MQRLVIAADCANVLNCFAFAYIDKMSIVPTHQHIQFIGHRNCNMLGIFNFRWWNRAQAQKLLSKTVRLLI